MNLATLEQIREEIARAIVGRRSGKVFPLSRNEIAVDLRLADSRYLFISVDPSDPRIYLIRRRMRDLEKASVNPSAFVMLLKKHLSGAEVESVDLVEGERVMTIRFSGESETGEPLRRDLIAQLTGRSANLFLLDDRGFIIDSLRQTNGGGQETGTRYSPPARPEGAAPATPGAPISADGFDSLSDALDAASQERAAEREFKSAANAARAKIKQELTKRERLLKRLETDLVEHGDAERWKKFGDLLLANISNARRNGTRIAVIDYFDESQPTIEIETDENDSLTEAAEKYFRRYTKARNAREEIKKRREAINAELERLRAESDRIEAAVAEGDIELLSGTSSRKQQVKETAKGKESPLSSVARVFRSSDGYEILVGKKAKDNDYLTFRIAKSLDTWMHAADYPGSHVVVRNPNRKEIPQRTLHEAAQLAGFYSQGKSQPKAAVHYTQKKFVNKPKGSAPGLVSLASFKTLLVEPKVPDSVINQDAK
jgi:predicted ribosome quality control (RQC) complex YloA/Tae2 family protein